MTKYDFQNIEKKWQEHWRQNQTNKTTDDSHKPKFYVLDMFPYPSGAGLHVGHPLGYIASDIIARYKRLLGFNVLHPMGYDAFGLPAEQYAIQTGQHPAVTTEENIKRYRQQLDQIGLSFDWDREVQTCDPNYYKWTQWAFTEMFSHWYDTKQKKARPIKELTAIFSESGNGSIPASHSCEEEFSAEDWQTFSKAKKAEVLHHYRIAYRTYMNVNWCEKLGTVLANDEIKDGYSVRGGHPVTQKPMKQWCLRVGAYAERLLASIDKLDWPSSLKEIQKHWIGKSIGASLHFQISDQPQALEVFTTRPDTVFGATFMVIAPEHPLTADLTTNAQKSAIEKYVLKAAKKTERDRMKDGAEATGVFTGSYCDHPFKKDTKIPIWISDYVLAGYGTGAIMAVPAHDERDYAFAKKFSIPIQQVIAGGDISENAFTSHDGTLMNSDFLDGLKVKDAIKKVCNEAFAKKVGIKKTQYRLRDAIFSRQRYWGEPIPIAYEDDIAKPLAMSELPLVLPDIDKYQPTAAGDPPLGRAKNWQDRDGNPIELTTMPGFAGSSAYYLRYMDPHNSAMLVDPAKAAYWGQVDLYVGGAEHATGHLIYSRFWNKFLYDIGTVTHEEPFQKIINQGMIQGNSAFVYRVKESNHFVSYGLRKKHKVTPIHIDISMLDANDHLDLEAFKRWRPEFATATFELEDGQYLCGRSVEKMSKSLFNVVNPDSISKQYGADTLRLYEMFLGPIEQSKPWNTHGIEGVYRFLSKLWRLFYSEEAFVINADKATDQEQKALHTLLKKVTEDMENFSLNTSVSAFMICVNDLAKMQCHKKSILEPLLIALSPFAPHIAEELWQKCGNKQSITTAEFPKIDPQYLTEDTVKYPVSVNGKMKFLLELPKTLKKDQIEAALKSDERYKTLTDGKTIKKTIIVPSKIINLVL